MAQHEDQRLGRHAAVNRFGRFAGSGHQYARGAISCLPGPAAERAMRHHSGLLVGDEGRDRYPSAENRRIALGDRAPAFDLRRKQVW